MKKLIDILPQNYITSTKGNTNVLVSGISIDSRKIKQNELFIALKGTIADGHNYINNAISNGAIAILCEQMPDNLKDNITCVQMDKLTIALGDIASSFYDNPSSKLNLVGITGTNGKTTVATSLYHLFEKLGYRAGLISTIKIMINKKKYSTINTTPDVITINKYLNEMLAQGVSYCFMEVSSHSIAQHRIEGLHFRAGVFTNLSHDHLDYHGTFANYRDTKKKFFDKLPKQALSFINIDDKNANVMIQNTTSKIKTYAIKSFADYSARVLENSFRGLVLNIDNTDIYTKFIGDFNVYNLLSVYAVADCFGIEKTKILKELSMLSAPQGRFEYVISQDKKIGIVDYAHTPNALENVLKTINSIKEKQAKTLTVIGCGGNRDNKKRPMMAQIAQKYSDIIILTSDNPRDENPNAIIEDMKKGLTKNTNKVIIENIDRVQAIQTACELAKSKDVILIAGKGHENYQEINNQKKYFNDIELIYKYLKLK